MKTIRKMNKALLLFCLLFAILFCSCKSIQYVPVETVKTEYITNNDTLIFKDSVYVEHYQKADTVYLREYKEKIIYSNSTDTICRIDSIPYIKEVEKVVTIHPNYEKWLWLYLGLTLLLGFTVIYLKRRF